MIVMNFNHETGLPIREAKSPFPAGHQVFPSIRFSHYKYWTHVQEHRSVFTTSKRKITREKEEAYSSVGKNDESSQYTPLTSVQHSLVEFPVKSWIVNFYRIVGAILIEIIEEFSSFSSASAIFFLDWFSSFANPSCSFPSHIKNRRTIDTLTLLNCTVLNQVQSGAGVLKFPKS